MRSDLIDNWITEIASNKSFVDIGGIGENSCNERVTTAINAGASNVAMADFEPYSFHLWRTFFNKMEQEHINGIKTYELIDIRDPSISRKLGKFDIVHSTGILYHLPDPVNGLYNLSLVTSEYLIVNTVIIPNNIENAYGKFTTQDSRIVFLPSLTDGDRLVLKEHYKSKFGWDINVQAPHLGETNPPMPYLSNEGLSCYPYWWLFTENAFRAAVMTVGFTILDEWLWEDHTLTILARRKQV